MTHFSTDLTTHTHTWNNKHRHNMSSVREDILLGSPYVDLPVPNYTPSRA